MKFARMKAITRTINERKSSRWRQRRLSLRGCENIEVGQVFNLPKPRKTGRLQTCPTIKSQPLRESSATFAERNQPHRVSGRFPRKPWANAQRLIYLLAALYRKVALVAPALLITSMFAVGAIAEDSLVKETRLGPVFVRLELAPSQPVIGDTVTLQIEVVAEEGVELLMPEFGEALDRFTILDYVPRERIDDDGRTVATQRYRLQPPISGKQSIPPILVEFVDRRPGQRPAPEDLDAYELLTDRLDFEVQSVLPKDAEAEIKPPLGRIEPREALAAPVWPWYCGAGILAVLIAAVCFWILSRWRRRVRRQSAYEIAHSRLERLLAQGQPAGENVESFFVELSAIIRRYLEDRFELRAPELTTEEFLEVASASPELTSEHQRMLREFLRQADLVKFAGFQPSSSDIEASINSAKSFLEETRENAPLIDVTSDGESSLSVEFKEAANV